MNHNECPICLEEIKIALTLSCCGKQYCESCASIVKNQARCPFCTQVGGVSVIADSIDDIFDMDSSADASAWHHEPSERKDPSYDDVEMIYLDAKESKDKLVYLTVKDLASMKWNVAILHSSLARDFKVKLSKHCDVCPDDMTLIVTGRLLYDDKSLSENDIKCGALVHMVRKMKGS